MQTPTFERIDPRYVDALIREARRQRSEYICGLIGAGWNALRNRLAPVGRGDAGRSFRATPGAA